MERIKTFAVGTIGFTAVIAVSLAGFAVMTVLAVAPLYLLAYIAKGILAT